MLLYHVLFTGTIKNTFSVLGTLHDCMLYFLKKKFADDVAKIVLRTAPAEGLFGFRAEYSVNTQTEPKTKICFGFPKPRPVPNVPSCER